MQNMHKAYLSKKLKVTYIAVYANCITELGSVTLAPYEIDHTVFTCYLTAKAPCLNSSQTGRYSI